MGSFVNAINLLGTSLDSLNTPVNYSFWTLLGQFFVNLPRAVLNMLWSLIYIIIRFVLNIVDFLQYFAKKLVGLDYWLQGEVSPETVKDSDVIFRFLYNSTVQRVFKYLVGVFAVLLIVFTIIAIVKSEYDYVTAEKDEGNSKASIFKRALKAIALVVLFPVMIVMGILASNAILASLINAFNINNNLTLGGQVFSASAYDANRFRLYASRGTRYAASNYCLVTAENSDGTGETTTLLIPTSIKTINPGDYNSKHPFTGFCFTLEGKNYLYYVEEGELIAHYNHYYDYLTNENKLGAILVAPYQLGALRLDADITTSNPIYAFKTSLHAQDGDSLANEAAYNTWKYNEVLTRDNIAFESTLKKVDSGVGFISDAGTTYSDAFIMRNEDKWGALHDGGADGFVPMQDEYYVMADVLEFMVGNNAPMAIVNIADPLIDWKYAAKDGAGYVNANYTHGFAGSVSDGRSIMVDYINSGKRIYEVTEGAVREDEGAIYIMAYYSANSNRYIPVINGKDYVDDNGNTQKFRSSYLASTYEGVVIARGLITGSYYNSTGVPSIITTAYRRDGSNDLISISDPYYASVKVSSDIQSWAMNAYDYEYSLNTNFKGLKTDSDGTWLESEYVGGIGAFDGNLSSIDSSVKSKIAASLPTSMSISYRDVSGGATNNLEELQWTAQNYTASTNSGNIGGNTEFLVFRANKTIRVHVDNGDFLGESNTTKVDITSSTIHSVPLFALVAISGNSTNGISANVYYVYSECGDAKDNWFQTSNSLLGSTIGISKVVGDCIFGGYNSNNSGGATTNNDGLKARILGSSSSVVQYSTNLSTTEVDSKTIPVSTVAGINYSSLSYSPVATSLKDESGNIFNTGSANVRSISSSAGSTSVYYTRFELNALRIMPTIDGSILNSNGTVSGDHFAELPSSRVQRADGTTYYFGLYDASNQFVRDGDRNIVVRLEYYSATNRIRVLTNDYYSMYIGGTLTGSPVKEYDMQFVRQDGEFVIYRYSISSQYYYFRFKVSNNGAIYHYGGGSSDEYKTNLFKIDVNIYNAFVFKHGGEMYQYNPNEDAPSEGDPTDKRFTEGEGNIGAIEKLTYYVRDENIRFNKVGTTTAGNSLFEGYVYADNGTTSSITSGTVLLQMYYEASDNSDSVANVAEATQNAYNYAVLTGQNIGRYDKIPDYSSIDINTAKERFTGTGTTIQFIQTTQNKWGFKLDFSFNPLSWFTEGPLWRFKLGFFDVAEETESEPLDLSLENGRIYLDYNFNSASGMGLSTFYEPGKLNVLILVFASILVFIVIGQAIWGLIARIYDITLYFIIMPGVVSTMPLLKNSMYDNWRSELIKKVLSAYGVMIGLNFFFILIPAIRDASQLFTAADLELNIAQGSWLSFLTADAVNNLVYLLFLLVAFTLIKTLPSTIAGIIGAEDAYSRGGDVKTDVLKTVDEVGKHVSGQKAIDAFNNVKGGLKGFVPGSAIYDKIKDKLGGKDGGGKKDMGDVPPPPPPAPGTPPPEPPVEAAATEAVPGGTPVSVPEGAPEGAAEGAPSEEAKEEPKLTKAERELADLKAKREEGIAAHESGDAKVSMRGVDREKAIAEYNAANADSKIIDESDDSVVNEAFERFKASTGVDLSTMSKKDKGYKSMKKAAMDSYKKDLALEAWNKEHADDGLAIHSDEEIANEDARLKEEEAADKARKLELNARAASGRITGEERAELEALNNKTYTNTMKEDNEKNTKAAMKAFNNDQNTKMKNAAFTLANKNLDERIAKKEEEVALEKAGLTNLKGQSFFHRNRRSSADIGRHLDEQAEAQKAFDAANSKKAQTADSLTNAERQKLVAEYNKGKKKGELFSDMSKEDQDKALNEMLEQKNLDEIDAAAKKLEKANEEVKKDEFVVGGKYSKRKYKKFQKLQETLGNAEVEKQVENPKGLAQKLVNSQIAAKEAKHRLDRTNGRNSRKQLEQLDENVKNTEKALDEKNEAYRVARNKQSTAKTKEEKEEAKRAVKQAQQELEAAQERHSDAVAKRNKKAKSIADDENTIKADKQLRLNAAERNEGIMKKNLVKNRKALMKQLEQFGDKLPEDQRNELISRIANKEGKIEAIDNAAAARRSDADVKHVRFKKFKMNKSKADEIVGTTSIDLRKDRNAKNADEAKTAKVAEKFKNLTAKSGKKGNKIDANLIGVTGMQSNSKQAHQERMDQINARIEAERRDLGTRQGTLATLQSEYESLYMKKDRSASENARMKELKGKIGLWQGNVKDGTSKLRSLEAQKTRETNHYNRGEGISYTNKVNRLTRKRAGALDKETLKLTQFLNANQARLTPEQEARLTAKISGLQAARADIGSMDKYKRAKKGQKIKPEYSVLSTKQQKRLDNEAYKARKGEYKAEAAEIVAEGKATTRARKTAVKSKKFKVAGIAQTAEERRAEVAARDAFAAKNAARSVMRTRSQINAGSQKIQAVLDAKRANAIASAMVRQNKARLLDELIKKGTTPERINKAGLEAYLRHMKKTGAIDEATANAIAARVAKKTPKLNDVTSKNAIIRGNGKVTFAKGQKNILAGEARKAYQDAVTKALKKGNVNVKPPKTAAMAHKLAKQYERQLVSRMSTMTDKKINKLEADQRAQTIKVRNELRSQLRSLRNAEQALKRKTKKLDTTVAKILRERNSSRYKVPKITTQRTENPSDDNK